MSSLSKVSHIFNGAAVASVVWFVVVAQSEEHSPYLVNMLNGCMQYPGDEGGVEHDCHHRRTDAGTFLIDTVYKYTRERERGVRHERDSYRRDAVLDFTG